MKSIEIDDQGKAKMNAFLNGLNDQIATKIYEMFSADQLAILYQTKKKKEEEKNTFMSIVDLPIILLINALLEIKIKLPQAVPISLITNQNYSKKKNLRSIRCKISNIEFTLTNWDNQSIIGETVSISIKYKNHICKTKFYNFLLIQKHCISNCLFLHSSFNTEVPLNNLKTNKKNENTNSKINTSLPKKLLPFKDVFSEIYANELPPHRLNNCEIKLTPNSVLYYGPI
ncbi:hypothetical protein H8356DRAFT_1353753 [Neocallimastix lanati (nom. inval.)]|nr:hypothetical protein H8356DRAFT_1353753 [Neocallimastix sp. JGI-2020a]